MSTFQRATPIRYRFSSACRPYNTPALILMLNVPLATCSGILLKPQVVVRPCILSQTRIISIRTELLCSQGGYNLEATAASVAACVRVLLGERPPALGAVPPVAPSPAAQATIREVIGVQVNLWPL